MQRQPVKQADESLAWRGRLAAGLVAVTLALVAVAALAQVAVPVVGWRPVWWPVDTGPTDLSAAAAAQEFLRLVADSRRNDDTAPLPCVLVMDPGGLLNPCMDALTHRWAELEPIERIGSRLTVRTVTSLVADTAVVTDADIYPRPNTKISITLEYANAGTGWQVRQLNQRRLSRLSWNLRWWSPPETCREVGVGRPPRRPKTGDRCDQEVSENCARHERAGCAGAGERGDERDRCGPAGGPAALAVGAGLQVMQQLMEADVTVACGPRGKHDPDRTATRHGTEADSVSLGGRRVPVTRPRVRAVDGSGELSVPTYELFTSTEMLGRIAMERMLAGVSTRRYPIALEPVGEPVEADGKSTSKSARCRASSWR